MFARYCFFCDAVLQVQHTCRAASQQTCSRAAVAISITSMWQLQGGGDHASTVPITCRGCSAVCRHASLHTVITTDAEAHLAGAPSRRCPPRAPPLPPLRPQSSLRRRIRRRIQPRGVPGRRRRQRQGSAAGGPPPRPPAGPGLHQEWERSRWLHGEVTRRIQLLILCDTHVVKQPAA